MAWNGDCASLRAPHWDGGADKIRVRLVGRARARSCRAPGVRLAGARQRPTLLPLARACHRRALARRPINNLMRYENGRTGGRRRHTGLARAGPKNCRPAALVAGGARQRPHYLRARRPTGAGLVGPGAGAPADTRFIVFGGARPGSLAAYSL